MPKLEEKFTSISKWSVLVITPERLVPHELETCNALLAAGLQCLHIRKPFWDKPKVKGYIEGIDTAFRDRIAIHQYHELVKEMSLGGIHVKSQQPLPANTGMYRLTTSLHSLNEAESAPSLLSYAFISPIFNSISKDDYNAGFNLGELASFLNSFSGVPLIALGGMDKDNSETAKEIGFPGVALLGSLWQKDSIEERLDAYQEIESYG